MNQLQNFVAEVLLKLISGQPDAMLESSRCPLTHLDHVSNRFLLRLLLKSDLRSQSVLELVEILGLKGKLGSEYVLCPLDTVQGFLWEHFQSAMWDLVVLFWVPL